MTGAVERSRLAAYNLGVTEEGLTVEERLAALERIVDEIVTGAKRLRKKDWRTTIGMFAGDPVIGEIQEEGRKIREADRAQSRGQ